MNSTYHELFKEQNQTMKISLNLNTDVNKEESNYWKSFRRKTSRLRHSYYSKKY